MTEPMIKQHKVGFQPGAWAVDALFRALIGAAAWLPYERRVRVGGWVFSHLIAPIAGHRCRIRANLALICPDMPASQVRHLCRAVPDNIGRNLIELYSPADLIARAAIAPVTGAGMAALNAAHAAGRPVILVSGHFGNFNVWRAALGARGIGQAALYRPMNNRYFDAHYVNAMGRIAKPMFARNTRGLAAMLRHLRGGGVLSMLVDQRMGSGRPLRFFGHRAYTALSAAQMALKFDALLIPVYAVRQETGIDFKVLVESPVPHTTPEEMMQALNDSLEAMVRGHMDQWFWIHRRWATPRRHRTPGKSAGG
jgi:KDO2-lipid IV(A) lauroyltransferase